MNTEPHDKEEGMNPLQEKSHIVATQHSIHVGPIPSPEEFMRYKEVMPDLPERIIKQFEADSESARELKKTAQENDIAFDKRSQWMAFCIIITGLLIAFALSCMGKDIASYVMAIGTAAYIFQGTFSKR